MPSNSAGVALAALVALAGTIAAPGVARGQDDGRATGADPAMPRIDTVVILNHNVFGETGDGPGFVARLANALHITTRPSVIRRTLLLDEGEPFDSARATESERALRGLRVFRNVRVDTTRVREALALRVITADGWSTKPQANYSAAGGDETWEVRLVEQNLLGTATELALAYRRTPDRDGVELAYVNPHFLTRRVPLWLKYSDLSDGRRGEWAVGLPFYQTAAPWALGLDGEAARERVLVFRDGTLLSSPQRRVVRVSLAGGVATYASSRRYVRLWGRAVWRREDFAPDTVSVFPRSFFAAAGAGVELGHARYRVVEHFNSYSRREDVDLSQILRIGAWATPRAWGYPAARAGIGPEFRGQLSTVWRGGFAVARVAGHGIWGPAGLDSGRVRGSVTVMSQNLPRQTWIAHAEAAVARRPAPGGEYDLWIERRGPRLFGAHDFTGTRRVWLALEDRVLVADDVWGLMGVGISAFADWGGAWYADEPARLGGNVGIALRLGATRASRGQPAEFALGWRWGDGGGGDGWGFAVRQGIEF